MTKPAWLVSLEADGCVVVPNIIAQASCDAFIESAWQWLESFPYGFKRHDKRTWTKHHLPSGHDKGMYNQYAVNHESFVWQLRAEPAILAIFERIWQTDDLIASFDGINISLPVNPKTGRSDIKMTKAWPHIDQDPRNIDTFELYQGIANLAPNGPNDGGLVVLAGSHKLHKQHFTSIGGFRKKGDLGEGRNGYTFTDDDARWYRKQGCQEVKICANAGDLILWDSRTIHWNCSPTGERTRFAAYVCYCSRSLMSEGALQKKRHIFESRKGTTHWPSLNVVPSDQSDTLSAKPRRPDGSLDKADRKRPTTEPDVTDAVLRLVGVRDY